MGSNADRRNPRGRAASAAALDALAACGGASSLSLTCLLTPPRGDLLCLLLAPLSPAPSLRGTGRREAGLQQVHRRASWGRNCEGLQPMAPGATLLSDALGVL
ncbi:unnamed protein product [Prorocentrum cordatum]|uniref:Uncharacterized protein n=1 Tax=Prorocentrum cordatum TaxID=2364126 RepID=A0ABN9RUB5_9DINO|nr:unnamed protein product [Polarella glacialis]